MSIPPIHSISWTSICTKDCECLQGLHQSHVDPSCQYWGNQYSRIQPWETQEGQQPVGPSEPTWSDDQRLLYCIPCYCLIIIWQPTCSICMKCYIQCLLYSILCVSHTGKGYAAKDVVEGIEYEFRVSAINNSGAGEFSSPSEFVFARDPKSRWTFINIMKAIISSSWCFMYNLQIPAFTRNHVLQSLLVKSLTLKWQIPPTQPFPCLGPNPRTLRGLRMKPRDILWKSGLQKIQTGIAAITI